MNASPTSLSRSDRIALYLTIALGAVATFGVIWGMIARLVEVIPGRDVPVLVPFLDETAQLPIGPDGALVTVSVDQAVLTVSELAPATQFALIAQPLVTGIAILAGIVLLCLLCWNLARGRAFTRRNVRIILAGTVVLLAGWFLGSILSNMTVNGTLSAISDYGYDGVIFEADWAPLFAVLALGAIGAAFQIGERLQRETEGLI